NLPGASVLGGAGSQTFSFGGASPLFFGGSLENPALIASATNVVNHGLLSVGAAGLLRLSGKNIDLVRGGLEVEPASRAFAGFCFFGGSHIVTPTNFIPDPGVYDLYWFITNQLITVGNNLGLTTNADGTVSITAPPHRVARPFTFGFPPNSCYFTNFTQLSVSGAHAYVYFDPVTPTNWIYQTVFVANSDPLLVNDVRFYPSTIVTNAFQTVV